MIGERAGVRPGSILDHLGPAPRIAFCRAGRLGDVVVAMPALLALRRAVPRSYIAFITQRPGTLLREHLPMVDEVIEVPDSWDRIHEYDDLPEMRAFFARMQAQRYDLALQAMGGGDHMNHLMRRLGARITAGQRVPAAPALDVWMPFGRPLQPEAARIMDVLDLVGVPHGDLTPHLPVLPSDHAALHAALDIGAYAGPLIGVGIGSGSGSRRWAPDRYAATLDALLAESGGTVFLLGTEPERPIAADILRRMRDGPVISLAGTLSLGALIALLTRLDLYLGNDSGPAHLATALDVPSVLIYGSGHPGTWAPVSRARRRVVADITAPCRLIAERCGCPDDSSALCIAAVTPDRVLAEVRALRQSLALPAALQEAAEA